ncbi:DUF2630 family protein [Variovorax sp. J22P240]|uniref:DUF2630 family protein n=1 Tax=Variovorax sp. J22P240 TaxID=3053514 RepID=UPI0025781AFF|nr:DUF2630 family protein [Variovorax sp. J22P240]MDM0002748.1 DUF2630 family protein [Variovorax sp. J22P240]
MSDKSHPEPITTLVAGEHQLRSAPAALESNATRLRHVEEQNDQCWDLLRQRRAKGEFGDDPADAKVRDARTVEGYVG